MRIDSYLLLHGYFDSRTKAQQAICRGEVFVDGVKMAKPSFSVCEGCKIEIKAQVSYVSLGGYKMQKALDDFAFNVNDLIVADIGSSTGGFTDCLLQRGAKKVYAVDLNDDLLHEKLKNNEKVSRIIKNARDLTRNDFSDDLDLLVADLSFISLSYVLEVFSKLIGDNKYLILLIKPQFETGVKTSRKNGIIRDDKIHKTVCENVVNLSVKYGLKPEKITTAPLSEDKNKEFLILLRKCEFNDYKVEYIFDN